MRTLFTFGVVVALLAFAGVVHAYPTLTGPTGLAVVPTAYVAPGGFSLAADYQKLETGHVVPVRLLFALGSGVELGGAYDFFSDSSGLDKAWDANAKIRLAKILGGETAVGAQFFRLTDLAGFRNEYTQGYFAWTSGFSGGPAYLSDIGLTWGVNWTRFAPEGGPDSKKWRWFAGASLNIIKGLSLSAEYQTRQRSLGDTDPITAYTARYALSNALTAQVGTTNAIGLVGGPKHNIFAGLSLGFNGLRHKTATAGETTVPVSTTGATCP